jgi:ubiquitin-protein ligase
VIEFSCPGCGKFFSLRDEHAGKTARCKRCGASLTVPMPRARGAAEDLPPGKLPVRTRRLAAEAVQIQEAFAESACIQIVETKGEPPETYCIEYRLRGLERGSGGQPTPRNLHRVEIQLTSDYPRLSPQCRMLTPIFHPNIDPTTICVGDHWTAGERLVDLIIRIGEIISYQAYNIRSPLDGEAAMWADLHQSELPVDPISLRPAAT